ncbi:fibronectin type III domain-containing protein [Microbulbifer sp. M83]|uniref:fibronectin type III domain-containing protein n=1 Tax=Microbulbifer sp. M83 TaxID=3118246 RepID=UPI002FE31611
MRYILVLALAFGLAACGGGGGSGSGGDNADGGDQGGGTPTTPDDPSAPASPSGGTIVQDGNGNAVITWVDNADDETGFYLQRKVGADGSFKLLDQVGENVTSYTDDSVLSGRTYSYRVYATRDGDSSDSYTEVSITIANTGREDTYAKAYQFGEDQMLYITRVIQISGGEAILLGGSDNGDRFISRIDATGVPKWTRYIESDEGPEGHFTAWLQSSGGLYVIGQVRPDPESSGNQSYGAGRYILDPDTGEILASHYLRLADMQIYDMRPLDENNNGLYDSLLLVTLNFPDRDYFVVKTDLELNVKWSKEITGLEGFAGEVAAAPDGSVFFATQIDEPVYQGDKYLYLTKFDSVGNLVFQRRVTFGPDVPEINLYSLNVFPMSDAPGDYRLLLGGIAEFEPGLQFPLGFDSWFLAMDSAAEPIWKKRISSDSFVGLSFQGRDRPPLLVGRTETSVFYGSLSMAGELGPLFNIENDLDLSVGSATLLPDGAKLFEVETKEFDSDYVGIIAKVDADNNIPRLANGLVAEPFTLDTSDFTVNQQAESFSVVDWTVGDPITIQKRNRAVEITITDLVGQ